MTTLEVPPAGSAGEAPEVVTQGPVHNWRETARTVVRAVEGLLGPVNVPDYLSEHGGHAEKRNDPFPSLKDPRG